MDKHKITWFGNIYGEIEIEATSAQEAKEKLQSMKTSDLVKSSNFWNSNETIKIDCVDTKYGLLDEETWIEIEG